MLRTAFGLRYARRLGVTGESLHMWSLARRAFGIFAVHSRHSSTPAGGCNCSSRQPTASVFASSFAFPSSLSTSTHMRLPALQGSEHTAAPAPPQQYAALPPEARLVGKFLHPSRHLSVTAGSLRRKKRSFRPSAGFFGPPRLALLWNAIAAHNSIHTKGRRQQTRQMLHTSRTV